MNRTRKLVIISLLTGMGLILHIVEAMIPMTYIVPGAKLGLANIANLLGLVILGFSGGLQILILRLFLGSLLAGTFMTLTFYLSLTGGFLGYFLMAFFYYFTGDKFSIIGISVVGAVFHNVGQIITSFIIIASSGIFYYLPYLMLLSIPTGIGVGLTAHFTLNYLPADLLEGGF